MASILIDMNCCLGLRAGHDEHPSLVAGCRRHGNLFGAARFGSRG